MNPSATISCSCGCMFQVSFQTSVVEVQPKCPQCGITMNVESWKSLRTTMSELADFNQHIIKWHDERQEPRMLVPAITVSTL